MGIPSGFVLRNKPAYPEVTKIVEVNGVKTEEKTRRGPIPVCRVEIVPTKTHGPRKYRVSKAAGYWNVSAIMSLVDYKRPLTAEEQRTGKRGETDITKLEDWELWQKFGTPYCKLHTKQELIRFLSAFTADIKEALALASFLEMKRGTAKIHVSMDKGKTWQEDEQGEVFQYDDSVGAKPWKYRMDCLRLKYEGNDKFKVKLIKS